MEDTAAIAKPPRVVGTKMEQKMPPLHLACGDDEMRYNHSLIEVKNGIATATNGILLVRINLRTVGTLVEDDLENLEGKHIHMKTWAEIHKCEDLQFHETHIDCSREGIKKTYYYSNPQGEFFEIESIIDNVIEAGEDAKGMVAYNGRQLSILNKIFQHDSLNLSFSPGQKGTIIFPYHESGMFAVLMPMQVDNEDRYYFK